MNSARLIALALAPAAALMFALPASAQNDKNCKIVERDASSKSNDGTLSSSVTAGGGKVTAHTSGGNSITMNSGGGSVSSSVSTTMVAAAAVRPSSPIRTAAAPSIATSKEASP